MQRLMYNSDEVTITGLGFGELYDMFCFVINYCAFGFHTIYKCQRVDTLFDFFRFRRFKGFV